MFSKKIRTMAALVAVGMMLTMNWYPAIPVHAAQAVEDCVLFAGGDGESIYVDAGHVNMNGDIVTNGKFTTTLENPGINGTIYENQQNTMPDYAASIQSLYYSGEVNLVQGDYSPEDVNENISKGMQVEGNFTSDGKNIAINGGALMTVGDVTINGGSFSCSDGVIYSKEGNIHIAADNFSAGALFYAPNGTVYIECGNINMNGCVVAQSIEIVSSGGANLNKNQELIRKFGQTIQADSALNDMEDNNYVERREPETNQQTGNSGQQSDGAGQQSTGSTEQTANGDASAVDNSGSQGAAGSNEQTVIAVPLLVDDSAPEDVTNGNTDNTNADSSNSDVASGENGTMQFANVSKYEFKTPFDILILIYQIVTGQKGIVIFDVQ